MCNLSYCMVNRRGKGGSSDRFPLLGLQNHSWQWLQLWNQKTIASWQESNDKPRQCVEKQRYYSANKGLYSQGYGLPSGHIQLWELDHKKGRVPKNWCLWTVVLEKTSENPSDGKEIKPVDLKGDQPWILTGRTDAEAPVFWSSDVNRWLIGKVPNAGKDWGQEEKRASEEGWLHHITNAMNVNLGKLWEMVRDREAWHAAVQWVTGDWTTRTTWAFQPSFIYFINNISRSLGSLWWTVSKWKWKKVKSLSHVQLFRTPWTVAYQAPLSMGFFGQEHWSGLPFPSPGYLPNPGIKPRSPALQADALTSEPPGKPCTKVTH